MRAELLLECVDVSRSQQRSLLDPGIAADAPLKATELRVDPVERLVGALQRLQAALARPYDEHPDSADLADFPPDWAATISISCSS